MIPKELSEWQAAESPFAAAANPFGAPIFYRESTASTMQDAREIAARFAAAGEPVPHGAVAAAGSQSAGRGRLPGRNWDSSAGENLLCTVILRGAPANALALRAGLAAAKTFDSFLVVAGKDCTQVKWPNDVLYNGKKLSGILCEADGEISLVGAGLNIRQKSFAPEIAEKAASLALVLGGGIVPEPCAALELFLKFLKQALSGGYPWREELSKRLFMLNKKASFAPGIEGAEPLTGILRGVAEDGALILETKDGERALYSGELLAF